MKTDIELKDDVYAWLKGSPLMDAVSGSLCTRMRPIDSDKEDVVISVLANNFAQKQSAIVQVNIYVKDIKYNGRNEENTKRIRELARIACDYMESKIKDYRITINAQRIIAVDSIGYHVINNKLLYQYINEHE